MTLTRIRCFVEAARYENFTEAAQRLYISQPSLSKQIYLMEEELGVQLFYRIKRNVYLTPEGRYLYEELKPIPDVLGRAFETVSSMARRGAGSIMVGVLEGQEINSTILGRIKRFSEAYPQIDVQMERNGFRNLRAGVQNGHYDLIMTMSFEEENIPGIESRIIIPQRGAFAINRLNPKCEIPNLTLEMLADESFLSISAEESPKGHELLVKICRQRGFEPKIVRTLNSLESLILGVEAGLGIAMLDRNTRLEKNTEVRIVPVLGSDYAHVCAMLLQGNENRMVRALADALGEPDAANAGELLA